MVRGIRRPVEPPPSRKTLAYTTTNWYSPSIRLRTYWYQSSDFNVNFIKVKVKVKVPLLRSPIVLVEYGSLSVDKTEWLEDQRVARLSWFD